MDDVRFSRRRSLIIILCGVVLALLLAVYLTEPFRARISDRFVARGDAYLAGQDFEAALREYHKALGHNPNNRAAKEKIELAQKARFDRAAAEEFYRQKGVEEVVQKLNRAQHEYGTAKEALEVGVSFYAAGEYVYAQYPLRRAVELDPEYPEAWHYLGLTYQELAKSDPQFAKQAEEAFERRNLLAPKYLAE